MLCFFVVFRNCLTFKSGLVGSLKIECEGNRVCFLDYVEVDLKLCVGICNVILMDDLYIVKFVT